MRNSLCIGEVGLASHGGQLKNHRWVVRFAALVDKIDTGLGVVTCN